MISLSSKCVAILTLLIPMKTRIFITTRTGTVTSYFNFVNGFTASTSSFIFQHRPSNTSKLLRNEGQRSQCSNIYRNFSFTSTSRSTGGRYSSCASINNNVDESIDVPNSDDTATATSTSNSNSIDLHKPFFPIYYNDVYEVPLPPNHRFPMAKYRQVREIVQDNLSSSSFVMGKDSLSSQENQLQYEFRVSPLATIKDLITTHDPSYVDRYLNGNITPQEERNVGFPWSLEGVDRTLSSVGGTVAAATSICNRIRLQRLESDKNDRNCASSKSTSSSFGTTWSAHIAGGTHHAFYDYGEGFCIFSDIAVASNVLLRTYPDVVRRILVLDLDVHQGNGNAVLFEGRDDVMTFSMHCRSNYFSKREESDLDVELPVDCDDGTYLSTLQYWLKRIKGDEGVRRRPFDFIFFQSGVDILEEDRLGRMALSQEGLTKRNELVFRFATEMDVPLCITMGGGYPRNRDDWNPILTAHSNVYIQAANFLSNLNENY